MKRNRPTVKPVAKTPSKKGIGIGMPTNFTNAEAIKNNFLAHTSIRQAQKISNDGTYWMGGNVNEEVVIICSKIIKF